MNKTILISLVGFFLISASLYLYNKETHSLRSSLSEIKAIYNQWKEDFGKKTTGDEDKYRFRVFEQNYHFIQRYNAEKNGVTLKLTQFADLTREEWSASYLGYKKMPKKSGEKRNIVELSTNDLPDTFDWISKGAVNAIKNQGQCGSCWAFSTVDGLEGLYFNTNGTLLSFSEQQIVDCDPNDDGCDGGDLPTAYTYVIANGIELESKYPYAAVDQTCAYDASQVIFFPTAFIEVAPKSGPQMQAAVNVEVLPVCIEADSSVFQLYSSGVLKSDACGTNLDHCVAIVGYDFSEATESLPYWVIRNSWGTTWGQDGYGWIEYKADGDGICGINEEPVYPTGFKVGPAGK